MTDAMNAVHSPDVADAKTVELRQLLERVDRAVALAYGWLKLDLAHDFHDEVDAEGNTIVRHGLSSAAREQSLAALIELNRQRCEKEQTSAPVTKPRATKGRAKATPAGQGALALVDAPEPESQSSKTKAAASAKKGNTRRTSK